MYISKMSNKKQIFKENILKKLLNDENSCVSLVATTRLLPLPPFFLNDMKSGILYLLNNMLKKYDRSLGGIVIGYQNIKVLMDENTGIIPIGTSETEVNISVEFYIFQPKIGSLLEGVVNKKSVNHIGCLVHRYFNATILKPDDIDYNEWICQDFNVDDKIIFKVKDLDFTGLLPHIEGVIDDAKSFNQNKSNLNKDYDVDNNTTNDVNKNSQNEVLKKKNKEKDKDDEVLTFTDNVNRNTLELDSSSDSRKKKKKKKKEKEKKKKDVSSLLNNHKQSDNEKSLNEKELTSSDLSKEFSVDGEYYVKKKKKKDTKKKDDEDVRIIQESLTVAESVLKENDSKSCSILEKFVTVEDENKSNFVRPSKIKKEKKKKKSEHDEPYVDLSKTSQCLFSNEAEDNILYSTQIDSVLPKKMRISFCSPISKDTISEENCKQDLSQLTLLKNQIEKNEKEKNNKYKKRQREENVESEVFFSPKKIKTSPSLSSEKEDRKEKVGHNEPKKKKSLVQTMMEELFRNQLESVKESSDNSNKSSKEHKKKKEKFKNKGKEVSQEESLNLSKKKKDHINDEGGIDQNLALNSLLDTLRKQEIERVKEELNISDKESCKESKKTKSKVSKKEKENSKKKTIEDSFVLKKNKTELNGANNGEENFSVQEMMDRLLTQEMTRVKEVYENSDVKSFKESKKSKEKINKEETHEKKTNISLYDKLLENAKSALDIEKSESLTLPLAKESGKKKKKDFLNKSTSSSKKKGSQEKGEIIVRKIKDCHQTPEKYKNGNMYDVASTPQKMNFEKSLFSDSEQSHSTPVKRKKGVNGIESEALVEASHKKKEEALKSRSDKKKERKCNKSEQKSEIKSPSKKEESLYEKLLREAKSLIHSKNESTPKKYKSI